MASSRPRPLRNAATLAALVGLAVQGALLFGVNAEDVNRWAQLAALGVTALTLVGVVVKAEPQVTPVADPMNDAGEPLVPASSVLLADADVRAMEARLLEQSDNRPHDGDPVQPEEGTGADS